MSGNRYVLDTNATLAVSAKQRVTLLQGNAQLVQLLQNASWVGISVISQIEFLVFSGLTEADRQLFQQFLLRVKVVDLASGDGALIERIIKIRQQYRLKLPDAIIAAIAIQNSANLVTADQAFAKVTSLTVMTW